MAAFGEPLNDEEMKEILKYAKAVNGRIYYRDFVRTIINGKIDWLICFLILWFDFISLIILELRELPLRNKWKS